MATSHHPEAADDTSQQLDREIAELSVFSAWELKQAANHAFEPLNLTTFQVSVLTFIAANPHIRTGELAERMGVLHALVSTTVSKFIELGLLERVMPKEDRRTRTVSLTAKGEAVRDEAIHLWETVTASRYANLRQNDKKALLRVLKTVRSRHN